MKKVFALLALFSILASCNNENNRDADANKDSTARNNEKSSSGRTDLPYKASYSSSWSDNLSDDDLHVVLMSYKDWENGNIEGLMQSVGDSIEVDFANGDHLKASRDSLRGIWSKYRDSLSSVQIDMQAWHKMHSTDKNDSYIVTWYKETDTYKTGKVDSAHYHDINQVKNGKIIWYSQYRRVAK